MQARDMKDGVYGQFARIGKAVSAPKRIELLELLCQGPRTVEALADQAALTVANASQHLKVLRAARLVEAQKAGTLRRIPPCGRRGAQVRSCDARLAEARFAEVGAITRGLPEGRGALERVSGEELMQRVRKGEVTVLDVRPAQEYRAGHIPGRALRTAERVEATSHGATQESRDRRLLPRSVLRHGDRGRRAAAQARVFGPCAWNKASWTGARAAGGSRNPTQRTDP